MYEASGLAWLAFIVVLFGAGRVLVDLQAKQKRSSSSSSGTGPTAQYTAAPSLLTPTEAKFYAALRHVALPRSTVQCKVRLADLLLAPRHDLSAFRKVSQKHVDFVLCDPITLRPLVAIELDDRSHDRPDRQARDHFVNSAYASAKLCVLHIPVSSHYDPAYLDALIRPHLPA